jgi:hypothetical protein
MLEQAYLVPERKGQDRSLVALVPWLVELELDRKRTLQRTLKPYEN